MNKLDRFISTPIGPRDSVVASMLGQPHDVLTDTSPWIAGGLLVDFPEFWVDQVHDYVGGEL